MIWFRSDDHAGHVNIIKFCSRPFTDIHHMGEALIKNHNELVSPEDTVFYLGDVFLGNVEKGLEYVSRMNGHKVLLPGNHDRVFSKDKRKDAFWPRYSQVFEIWDEISYLWFEVPGGRMKVMMSHFPYDGDDKRFAEARPIDEGLPLIHGHTHKKETVSFSDKGTLQIHVGVDSTNFKPISETDIIKIIGQYHATLGM